MESSWKNLLDLTYNNENQSILGVNFNSGIIKFWSTDINLLNFSPTNRKKSQNLFIRKNSDKENSCENSNRICFGNFTKPKISKTMSTLSKSIDKNINLPSITDINFMNKNRSKTPKIYKYENKDQYLRNSVNGQPKSPFSSKKQEICVPSPQTFERRNFIGNIIKRNINPLKERVNKIDEVSAECESSILNLQKCMKEELKLSSFLIDDENGEQLAQRDFIQEVYIL